MHNSSKFTVDDAFTLNVMEDKSETEEEIVSASKELVAKGAKPPHGCPLCDYKTGRRRLFFSHLDAHLEKQPQFKCDSCQFVTFFKQVLSSHKAQCNYKKIHCPHCAFVTIRHRSLRKHLRNKHSGVEIFLCRKCHFKSDNKEVMEEHKRVVHVREKKYKCELCSFQVSRHIELRRHQKEHDGKFTNLKIFNCDLCSYESLYKVNVVRHRSSHIQQ